MNFDLFGDDITAETAAEITAENTVTQMLRDCADAYDQRNELYGNNYLTFGKAMVALFPKGISCRSVDDYNRIGVIVQIVSKIGRYCNQFESGGHDDSLLDLAVYSQMLREIDAEINTRPPMPF